METKFCKGCGQEISKDCPECPSIEPAFPQPGYSTSTIHHQGISVRDYFAAHAPDIPENWIPYGSAGNDRIDPLNLVVLWRNLYADAMLKERSKS